MSHGRDFGITLKASFFLGTLRPLDRFLLVIELLKEELPSIEEALKGEIVIIIEKGPIPNNLEINECVLLLQKLFGLSLKEAIKKASTIMKIPKKQIYKKFIND